LIAAQACGTSGIRIQALRAALSIAKGIPSSPVATIRTRLNRQRLVGFRDCTQGGLNGSSRFVRRRALREQDGVSPSASRLATSVGSPTLTLAVDEDAALQPRQPTEQRS